MGRRDSEVEGKALDGMDRTLALDPIERLNLGLCVAAVAVSLALISWVFALSLALGALLEVINFRSLFRSAQAFFDRDYGTVRVTAGGFGVRFVLLAAAIGIALHYGAHPVGLVIGLSLVIPAAVIEAWRARPRIDPDAPVLDPDDEAWNWNPWLAREREPADDDDDEERPA